MLYLDVGDKRGYRTDYVQKLMELNPAGATLIQKASLAFNGTINFSNPRGYTWGQLPALKACVVITNSAGTIIRRLHPAFLANQQLEAMLAKDGTIDPTPVESPVFNPAISVPAASWLGLEFWRINDITAVQIRAGLEVYI